MAARLSEIVVTAARNGRAFATKDNATNFLLAHPRGAYTSARTIGRTKVFDFDMHMQRLANSIKSIYMIDTASPSAIRNALESHTIDTMRAAMTDLHERFDPQTSDEYKLTLLVCLKEESQGALVQDQLPSYFDIFCHIGLLPPARKGPVKLEIMGMPRENAAAKDTKWVQDRQALYDRMESDTEEIVLVDPATQTLPEGSQTNFFVIHQDCVYTADEDILQGTVRELVLEVCRENDIPIKFEAPKLTDISEWDACFISSTSRIVLRASCVKYKDAQSGEMKTATFEDSKLFDQIASHVHAAVDRKSMAIFNP